jgi:hypothetical protein
MSALDGKGTKFPNGINVDVGELFISDVAVTSSAAELNILDGVTKTAAQINDLATLTGTETLTGKTLTTPAVAQKVVTHDYAAGAADWTLTADELRSPIIMVTNANGAVNAIFSTAVTNFYLIDNQSGQALTCKKAGGTGIVVASTKRAILWMNGTDIVRISADA